MSHDHGATVRCTAVFTGTVQGVGFRAATRRVAAGFAVTGWVRNEPDGSVRCVAEGAPDEVGRFLTAVEAAMASLILEVSVERSPATGEFHGFSVRQ